MVIRVATTVAEDERGEHRGSRVDRLSRDVCRLHTLKACLLNATQ